MNEMKIIYRSNSHAPFWIVAEKAGLWEKNGLSVNTSPQLMREKAVEALLNRHVDMISGNHHNLYARRVRNHEDFVHLAQVGNLWTENRMVVGDGIHAVKDLKGKHVAIDRMNSHAGLNVWLFLRQEGLEADKGDVELIEVGRESTEKRWKGVVAGEFDAAFVGTPHDSRAARAGARVITVRPMPMIRGVTLTTIARFVREREEDVRRLLRGVAEAIHFFLRRKEETLSILDQHVAPALGLESDEEIKDLYDGWTGFLEAKPYPNLEAIANVFALALRRDPDIKDLNPLALWDTHYVRELDDSGFIDALYEQG